MPRGRKSAPKPLARVTGKPGKVSAKVYRGRFTSSEHMKYLDMAALKRAKKALIDVGSVKAAGQTIALQAEVRNGMVTKLRPTHCKDCTPAKSQSATSTSARAQAAKAALKKVRDLGLRSVRLPVPVARLRGGGTFGITITIIVDWEWCIVIEYDDGSVCYICTQTPSFCIN
jgi:hypothetical protein